MIDTLTHWLLLWKGSGPAGLVIFALAFVFGALIFAPRPVLCFLGGLAYGVSFVPLALTAATVGSVAAFLLSRYLFRPQFLAIIETRPLWKITAAAIEAEGWRFVALLRLASPVPATIANYSLGLTPIRTHVYAAATFLGIAPQTVLFVYLGAVGKMAVEDVGTSRLQFVLIGLGLVTTALAVLLVARRVVLARRAQPPTLDSIEPMPAHCQRQ